MSDPVSNAEIEDVLSSIRRLVSEDASPLHRRKQIAEGAKERFVLTPALRVSQDEVDEALVEEAETQDAGADHPDDADQLEKPQAAHDPFAESRQTLEQRIAELEAALQQSTEEWEPDGSEVADGGASGMPSIADAPEVAEAQPEIEALDTPPTEGEVADVATLDWSDVEEPEAEPAEEPEAATDIVNECEALTPGIDFEPAEAASELETMDESGVADAPPDPQDILTGEEVAEQEAVEEQPVFFEPGQNGAPEVDPIADAEDEDSKAEFELFDEFSVIDEEALRDMVSQLVRDELQGVLGERITRNVRRLVRREIQRAMAMRELE